MQTIDVLGGLTPKLFLQDYWQKRPLLIRGAFSRWHNPLSPDELAGLACAAEVESRLVLENAGNRPWEVRHGPFRDADFANLPESHWTLLVQDVDKHVPTLADLLVPFRFIPDWRIDDLMISFAPQHGSVGPHVDAYDVFLLQGLGERRWQIAAHFDEAALIPDIELQILRAFVPEQEWTLSPGDMLYLPPGIAHHGVALNECMTYSIGFRAPGHYELVHAFLEDALSHTDPARRYSDPDLDVQAEPGQVSTEALGSLRDILRSQLSRSDDDMDRWLGAYLSESKEGFRPYPPERRIDLSEFLRCWQQCDYLLRDPGCRFLFLGHPDGSRTLFIDGNEHPLSPELAHVASMVCNARSFRYDVLKEHVRNPAFAQLMCDFYNQGYMRFEDD